MSRKQHKPDYYITYEQVKDDYLHAIVADNTDKEDLFYQFEDLLHSAHSVYTSVKQLQEIQIEQTLSKNKNQLYTLLILDLKFLVSHLHHFIIIDPEDIKDVCNNLLTLYGKNVLALEQLLAQERKFLNKLSLSGLYADCSTEHYFKHCIYKVVTQNRASIFFVDVTQLFNLLRQRISILNS
jgi:hypothetical protein